MYYPSATSSRRGFTIVEILITVMVIVVLLAILVPSLNRAYNNSAKAAATAQLGMIQTGLQQYYTDFTMYPPSKPTVFTSGANLNRGSVMLAEGLMGFLGSADDGAGSPIVGDPAYGFRKNKGNAAMAGMGQIYGPYASADPKGYKVVSNNEQYFIDPWGKEILYYRSTRSVQGAPTTPVTLIFSTGSGNNYYFDTADNSTATLPTGTNSFYNLINGNNTNTPSGSVTGATGYLLISAGPDGNYFTADDIVAGK